MDAIVERMFQAYGKPQQGGATLVCNPSSPDSVQLTGQLKLVDRIEAAGYGVFDCTVSGSNLVVETGVPAEVRKCLKTMCAANGLHYEERSSQD